MIWMCAAAVAGGGLWPEGTTLYVGADGKVFDVTGGGSFMPRDIVADLERYVAGQVAFTADRQLALVTSINTGEVMGVTPEGTFAVFATGLAQPSGIWRTVSGRIIVAEFDDGSLIDITAGGSFEDAVPVNTGLFAPRCLAESPDGTLFVSDQYSDAVYIADLGGGPVTLFAADMPSVRGIAWHNGALYAAFNSQIVDITAGGIQTGAIAFATGAEFFSLAATGDGRLVSGELFGAELYDVTAGGNLSSDDPWATSLPIGETNLGTAPPDPNDVVPTPEDSHVDTGTAPPVLPVPPAAPVDPGTDSRGGCACGPASMAPSGLPWLVVLVGLGGGKVRSRRASSSGRRTP
ncbi:MAG: hypothetical protein AAGA48_00775 [Myxococcota bacterium]